MSVDSLRVEVFKVKLLEAGVRDPIGLHHVFTDGGHGQKLHFDTIADDSELFREWATVTADFLRDTYEPLPEVLLGVANGGNRLAIAVAEELGGTVVGLETVKKPKPAKGTELSARARHIIGLLKPSLAVVVEDVGTTGSTSLTAATAALEAGADRTEVVNTWQRREKLEYLIGAGVTYHSVIKEVLPTYTAEDCQANGFCAQGWELIPYGK